MRVKHIFLLISAILLIANVLIGAIYTPKVWYSMILFGPLILVGIFDLIQTKHTIRRNFPVIGHLRYALEGIRPEIMQYFVERDTEGRPFHRIYRSMVYQRAKGQNDTEPFGTQSDVYRAGYEWMDHSIYPLNHIAEVPPRITIGGPECTKPYEASILNISAMSYGSLSKNAVLAMNGGAKDGGFAHNTGEGGLSPYHLAPGGDVIWQVGTGYFGCRAADGSFSPEKFKQTASAPTVKMIEIKLSQGAKPGHGGILPSSKNTEEIAKIRGVEPHTSVHSPPSHSAFSDDEGLCHFIQQLRELSGGKPVGFKLCIGRKREFVSICKAIIKTGIKPDFIVVDGGEGGTGAAPVEFANSLGMPFREGLAFAADCLRGFNLKKEIRLGASGKIITGFHMVRAFALGADFCYSARAMMMAVGCIQALECNTNKCPVGVATQDKSLMSGLVVEDKRVRVARFHKETVDSALELMAAAGFSRPDQIRRVHINRRAGMNTILRYDEIYPVVGVGALLNPQTYPAGWDNLMAEVCDI